MDAPQMAQTIGATQNSFAPVSDQEISEWDEHFDIDSSLPWVRSKRSKTTDRTNGGHLCNERGGAPRVPPHLKIEDGSFADSTLLPAGKKYSW